MNHVDRIRMERESLKARVALRDAYFKLKERKEFFEVIEKAFMVEDCARNARVSGLTAFDEAARKDALAKAQAAGHLQEYFETLVTLGNAAERSLIALDEQESTSNVYDMEG